MNPNLKALHDAGVSIWLDDLSRKRIRSGELASLIAESSVTGVTTNPTIFAAAFQDLSQYGEELASLKDRDAEAAIAELMSRDVAEACRIFGPTFETTGGYDGRVSIEVSPVLANETQATIDQAAQLVEQVGEPNVLIKIPATKAGLPAIAATIGAGISVNVTLIFSLERYREVMEAYLTGLEQADAAGIDLSTIHSVASFFVSRVDTEVDARLGAIGTPEALDLRGRAAVANAQLAYEAYLQVFTSPRFRALAAKGANRQRPLWASTGVKNPDYSDVLYVTELVADGCVNTMPAKTLAAFADHGVVSADTISGSFEEARAVLAAVEAQGISLSEVCDKLEVEGVDKFIASWDELVAGVTSALAKA